MIVRNIFLFHPFRNIFRLYFLHICSIVIVNPLVTGRGSVPLCTALFKVLFSANLGREPLHNHESCKANDMVKASFEDCGIQL